MEQNYVNLTGWVESLRWKAVAKDAPSKGTVYELPSHIKDNLDFTSENAKHFKYSFSQIKTMCNMTRSLDNPRDL